MFQSVHVTTTKKSNELLVFFTIFATFIFMSLSAVKMIKDNTYSAFV